MTSPHPTPTEREKAKEIATRIMTEFPYEEGQCSCGDGYNCLSGVDDNEYSRIDALAKALSLYAKQARDEAYEKAAKVADVHNANCVNAYCDVHIWVAKAIRQLKESK